MSESEPWCFTVVRTHGMRLMRPEKSWRPIITLEVDKHHCHETVMGVDGQNPNLKERFYLHQAHPHSRVDIRVWHRSQSKKKTKKRNLVATASHSLAELLKRQDNDPRAVRLQCQAPSKRAVSSRGKPQNGATLVLRVRPPSTATATATSITEMDGWESSGFASDTESSTNISQVLTPPPYSTNDTWPDGEDTVLDVPPRLRRRRRPRVVGYAIDSGDEVLSTDDDEDEDEDEPEPIVIIDDGPCPYSSDEEADDPPPVPDPRSVRQWLSAILAPSLLPQYTETEKIEVPRHYGMSCAERVLASFTTYSELRAARVDSDFERVFVRLQMEWTYVGGLLVALAAVSTAVFAIAPDSIFAVDTYARSAIAASSIASGLGIASDAWFLLRYNWADLHTFITRARDIYASYFFFALSARLPALLLFLASLALLLFLALVAFDVAPAGVLLLCFGAGMVMGAQFLVWGVHRAGRGVRKVGGAVCAACGRVFGRGLGWGKEGEGEGEGKEVEGEGEGKREFESS
ncbi:hypothetical protein D9615_010222 [Tricholomella constricta]|uniref:Uncharacterized protein n=1 Tax=Tricholomella constricta TaxID=117010 RepID=A0A8H5GRG3_9AGAR|nr:hypothetical protein D9615_010222 [Tricholomella constricta]